MVQGHTLDAVLSHSLRHGVVHDAWQSARGLTAVSFLFAAGLAFHQTTLTRLDAHRATQGAARRRCLRALRLIGLGYLLHVPLALLWVTDGATRARIVADFLSVDVLQCMGVSLLLLEGLVHSVGRAPMIAMIAACVGLLMFATAPLAHGIAVSGHLAVLTGYLSPQGGSIFPLLPWAGHFALGVALAQWARDAWPLRLAVAAVVLALAGFAVQGIDAAELTAMHMLRLASVVGVCAVLAWLLREGVRLTGWLERLAGETLAVYVFHILLVYGAGAGLGAQIGPRLSLGWALLVTALVLVLSVVVASTWRRLWARTLRRPALA